VGNPTQLGDIPCFAVKLVACFAVLIIAPIIAEMGLDVLLVMNVDYDYEVRQRTRRYFQEPALGRHSERNFICLHVGR
jgi:hypothetical protein